MSRMSRPAAPTVAALTAGLLLAGCGGEQSPQSTLTGAAAKSAQDSSERVRQLLAPQPASVGEQTTPLGPVGVVAPRGFTEGKAGPASPRQGWTYKRLTDPAGNDQTSLGLVVSPTKESSAEQSASTIAQTGGSREAGRANGLMTTTTWEGKPAYLVYVNTSSGLHVEALAVETAAGTVTVIAQAPISTFPQTGLRRALKSVDLTP